MERGRSVHKVIHRLWRQDSRRRSVVYRRERRGPGHITVVRHPVGSRLVGRPRFVVRRRFVIESALAEANSFLGGCQPFCNIARVDISGSRCIVTGGAIVAVGQGIGRGLTQRKLVSTLEQSPVRGDTAATRLRSGTAPASKTDELTNGNCVHTDSYVDRCGLRMPDATRRDSRGQGQADLSAEQPAPGARAWLPAADAHPGRPGDRGEPSRQGSAQADCVIPT